MEQSYKFPKEIKVTKLQIEELFSLPKETQSKRKRVKTGVSNSIPDIEDIKEIKKEALVKERRKTAQKARKKLMTNRKKILMRK